MKIFSAAVILLAASAVSCSTVRDRRDVSELAPPNYDYLPPTARLALPADETTAAAAITTTEAVAELATNQPDPTEVPASVRGANGYEYRTVRRLKYRHRARRDVSHLLQHQEPHQRYLPPAALAPNGDYLPPQKIVENFDDSDVVEAAAPVLKVANEYLPPVNSLDDSESPVTETAEVDAETEAPDFEATETPVESAVLAADGYHYRQPENPMEIVAQPKAAEYLPPLEKDVIEAEGPEHESAVLAADGYHYRAVKRLRF